MFRTITFTPDDGSATRNIFLSDVETGNTAKDVLTVPGVYKEIAPNGNAFSLQLEHLQGSIGAYKTSAFMLVVEGDAPIFDTTNIVSKLLTIPETAANALIGSYSEEEQEIARISVDAIHFYGGIRDGDKLCIPSEAFNYIATDIAESMRSVRSSYALKGTDNQEIFQTSFDAEFGVLLPTLEDIHIGGSDLVNALDILRVIAPYRRQERPGVFSYRGIYHTPYYRTNPRIMGNVPSYLSWINGYSTNDMLDFAVNERHMVNNLQTLLCADVSVYVSEMVSGIFFDSPLGSLLTKLCTKKDAEVIQQLLKDIQERNTAECHCNIPYNKVDELHNSGWEASAVVAVIKSGLEFSGDYLRNLIADRPAYRRTVDCENLPFTLVLSDADEQCFTELMISMGFISSAMQRFMIELCQSAYRVNWGHTGATRSIPGYTPLPAIDNMDSAVSNYLDDKSAGKLGEIDKYPALYLKRSSVSDDDDDDDTDTTDELTSRLDYYVTPETEQRIMAGTLPHDFFTSPVNPVVQSAESAVIEYWRNTPGEVNLDNFISSALLRTADTSILIECFIKLMRWGDRKPKLLVLQKHPEIRHVFDLGTGIRVDNTAIVDESELVQFNGCDYSLQGFLYSESNPTLQASQIIGFILSKDYGSVKKTFLASWVDLGEMFVKGDIKVGDFVAVNKVDLSQDNWTPVEFYSKQEYGLYVSDSNIEQGLKLKVQPKDLNALALLTVPGIMNSREYLRSLKDRDIVVLKDRQYDLLRRYVATVSEFYVQKGAAINNARSTVELSSLAEEFYNLFLQQGEGKQERNVSAAVSTLKTLNLGMDPADLVKWDTTELSGKFYIISDMNMMSTLPPIDFTNPSVKATAQKARNRVVLLLLQKDGKFIFCRKDIQPNEVMIVTSPGPDGKPKQTLGHKTYKTFASLVGNLLKGVDATINKQPAVLHESLKGFIDI